MDIDTEWFINRIKEKYGSQRQLILKMRYPGFDQPMLSRALRGERALRLNEARALADALDVPMIDVLIHMGALKPREVREWASKG